MQFKPEEYLLLSRRGSVPLPVRSPTKPHRERPARSRPHPVSTRRRTAGRRGLRGRLAALRDLRGGRRGLAGPWSG